MKNKLDEDQARIIILQLLLILKLLHSKEIVHGNLIPEKVMLRSINSLEICLSDFSQSIVTHNTDSQSERQYFEMGLAEKNNANNLSIYHAPEVITN